MIDVRTRLPKEDAAVLIAAVDAARDQLGPPPPKPDPAVAGDCGEPAPGVGVYSKADALVDVARVFLTTAPQDRSGEDRTLVVVHVSADNLGRVPAGTQESPVLLAEPVEAQSTGGACMGGVPARTSSPAEAVCHIENVGSVETATAQKVACDNPVMAVSRSHDEDQQHGSIVDDRLNPVHVPTTPGDPSPTNPACPRLTKWPPPLRSVDRPPGDPLRRTDLDRDPA
jgi:hypothetical protein